MKDENKLKVLSMRKIFFKAATDDPDLLLRAKPNVESGLINEDLYE